MNKFLIWLTMWSLVLSGQLARAGLVSQSASFSGGTAMGEISGPLFCNYLHTGLSLTELSSEAGGSRALFTIQVELRGKSLWPDQELTLAMINLANYPQTINSQYLIEEQWLASGVLYYDHPVIVTTHLTNQLFPDNLVGAVAAEATVTGGVFTVAGCNLRRNVWIGGGVAPSWFNDWTALITLQGEITESHHFLPAPEPGTCLMLLVLALARGRH